MDKALVSSKIEQELNKDCVATKAFLGVYPRDMLPIIKTFPSSVIINTDPSHLAGRHWIAFYFDDKKKCTFFDSYGNNPSVFNLNSYLKQFSIELEFNKQRLQGLTSSSCGHYCIFFIRLISRGYSLDEIIQYFSKNNFSFNDNLVEFLIKEF